MNCSVSIRITKWCVAAGLVAMCCGVQAADRYAVLALIGDDLSVVTYQPSVGSNLDRNVVQHVANDDDRFDRVAVQNATSTIRRVVPDATTFGLKAGDSADYALDDEALRSPERMRALLDALRPRLRDATRLVVISKSRGDAHLRTAHSAVGSGKLRGLGFYLDYLRRTRTAGGDGGRGFIAPYAYVAVTLIDVATGEVIASEPSHEGTMVSIANVSTAIEPWEALSAERKVTMLSGLIRRAMETTVPHVVAPG